MAVDAYLAMIPRAAHKWVVRCAGCGRQGYRPDLPETAKYGRGLRWALEPLEVDDSGRCDACRSAVRQAQG
jgi:hypothetical protein